MLWYTCTSCTSLDQLMFKARVCTARSSKSFIGRVDTTKTVLSNMLSMICRNTMLDLQQHCTLRPMFLLEVNQPSEKVTHNLHSQLWCTSCLVIVGSTEGWGLTWQTSKRCSFVIKVVKQSSNCHGYDYNETVGQLGRFQAAAHTQTQLHKAPSRLLKLPLCVYVHRK